MRIEELTKESVKNLSTFELKKIRSRFLNIYGRYFEDSDIKKALGMERKLFLDQYIMLRSELAQRDVNLFHHAPIDKEVSNRINRIFKKAIWSLDVPALGEMMAVPDYITVSGDFIKSPKSSEKIEVVIKSKKENRSEGFERKIGEMIKEQTGKEPYFTYTPEGPDSSYIPIFDLILKAQEETRKIRLEKKVVPIEKPEETDDTIRIPVGGDCDVTATITIDESQGIKALYCGRDKEVRTYLFDKRVKAWTMASARAWIKEHKEKLNKQIEENLETFEYLIHHVEVDGDEEIVHHCHMYDHIGNLFEQAHLWIDKGKIYLEGKEIKEGHYHVIKGLEPTQEIAWSEKEATDAGIKPKGMMSGMTLKEKAKAW